ncbi:hypothetical protein BJX99DRAFT_227461 [Aspergillus californicus]
MVFASSRKRVGREKSEMQSRLTEKYIQPSQKKSWCYLNLIKFGVDTRARPGFRFYQVTTVRMEFAHC